MIDKPGHRLTTVERSGPPRRTFWAECGCGYEGQKRRNYALASDDGRMHLGSIPALDAEFFTAAGFSVRESAALEKAFMEVNR